MRHLTTCPSSGLFLPIVTELQCRVWCSCTNSGCQHHPDIMQKRCCTSKHMRAKLNIRGRDDAAGELDRGRMLKLSPCTWVRMACTYASQAVRKHHRRLGLSTAMSSAPCPSPTRHPPCARLRMPRWRDDQCLRMEGASEEGRWRAWLHKARPVTGRTHADPRAGASQTRAAHLRTPHANLARAGSGRGGGA